MIVPAEVAAITTRFNEMYGHAAILREYVGAGDNRLKLVGQLQHGWSVGSGVRDDPTPIYFWNQRSTFARVSAPEPGIYTIGSPYLYLPPAPDIMDIGRAPSSLLALPQHSTSGHRFEDVYNTWYIYGCWLAGIRNVAGLEQVTVCLHENDYNDAGVRVALGRSGTFVATCGDARLQATTYLDRMRALILQHGLVTSNAIGTALMYAAYEGKPVFIGGPPPTMVPMRNTPEQIHECVYDSEWLDKEFPGWRCDWNHAAPKAQDAQRELGADFVLTKSEMWTVLQFAVTP